MRNWPKSGHTSSSRLNYPYLIVRTSQVVLVVKNLPAKARDLRDSDLIPGSGRSPGEGNSNSLQCSWLGNPMDRGAWLSTVMGSQRVWHNGSDLACTHTHSSHCVTHRFWCQVHGKFVVVHLFCPSCFCSCKCSENIWWPLTHNQDTWEDSAPGRLWLGNHKEDNMVNMMTIGRTKSSYWSMLLTQIPC